MVHNDVQQCLLVFTNIRLHTDGVRGLLRGGALPFPLHRDVVTAVGLMVIPTAGAHLATPMYPEYQQLFGFTDLTMTVIYATLTIVTAPALLLFGPATDALGKRIVVLASIALSAVAALCFLLANDAAWLITARVAQGISLAAATAAGTVLIIDRIPPARRSWASLIATVAFVGGTAAGTLFSGFAAEYLPFPRYSPYGLLLVLLAVVWFRALSIESSSATTLRAWRPLRPRVPSSISRRFLLAALAGSVGWLAITLFLAVIPTLLARAAGVTNTFAVGSILAAMLLCSMITQLLVVRMLARTMQLVGLALLILGLTGLAVTGGTSLLTTLICAVVAGLGHGFTFGGATASVDEVTTSHNRGSVNAALYLNLNLAAGVPAIAIGVLSSWIPLGTALASLSWFGVITALTAIVAMLCSTETTSSSGRPPGGGSSTCPAGSLFSVARLCASGIKKHGVVKAVTTPDSPQVGANLGLARKQLKQALRHERDCELQAWHRQGIRKDIG